MQNLAAILGSPEAVSAYLALCQSKVRYPVFKLEALEEDGETVVMDLTPYFKSAGTDGTDEMKAHQATFVLANPADASGVAIFDKFGDGVAKDVLAEDAIIYYQKGLKDPATGIEYLLPAHFGRVVYANPVYNPRGEQTITVVCSDAMKHLLKPRKTTIAYENTQANKIATDILTRYGNWNPAKIDLAATDKSYRFVQFPDYPIGDALRTLFDPLLFMVRADEAGNITTRPRLGSPAFGAGLLGFPDQLTEPDAGLVSYTIPNTVSVSTVGEVWQDFEGVFNQAKVMGKAVSSVQALGPMKLLFQEADTQIGPKGKRTDRFPFTQNGGSGVAIVAKNVIVRLDFYTNPDFPRVIYLSNLTYRGEWDADTQYSVGQAVLFDVVGIMTVFVCAQSARGAGQSPDDTNFWQETEIKAPFPENQPDDGVYRNDFPFWTSVRLWNEDPHYIGQVDLVSVTASYLTLRIEGRPYSLGGGFDGVRHYGGFNYGISLIGQPQSARSRNLTGFADYNTTVVVESLTEPFADHLTYQASHQPFALSFPVEVFNNDVSLGVIAADQTILTGEQNFGVDWERGRITLRDLAYQDFDEDSVAVNPYSTGGTAETVVDAFSTDFLSPVVPQVVLQSRRDGDSTYTFDGLTLGTGYDIRLTFADPTSTEEGQRVFSVYAQGEKVVEGLDIYQKARRQRAAYQELVTGIAPDIDGKIIVHITQHDPISGTLLPECDQTTQNTAETGEVTTGVPRGTAIVSAIEVLDATAGTAAAQIAVNCGGEAYDAVEPVISANYAYSPIQERYQAQQIQVDSPLLATQEECVEVAEFEVNRSRWAINRFTVKTSSVPHLQPGDMLRFFHPRILKDVWVYIQGIHRELTAPSKDGAGGADDDSYSCYLIYREDPE